MRGLMEGRIDGLIDNLIGLVLSGLQDTSEAEHLIVFILSK